ncbi:4-hydroxy-3-methylbut-2-enyl diphosphate reductase [Cytophagaceae bacterium DM2B3-1]|uniref:4-hydroxy-3-methylbut-2-enyl diphosphate reductase n=1 Tax=Xanthocytophaga flava TaxID=3048013 RepID=A0AAE3QQD5_9BACT|nr:4-hydroxy-3-methylbut-2-enyl diphosphate reductase [Xanthocytophaga flavus]MDJ1470666.1 4-hydroxy-3-methylbut-2-enyl diphosphate reductase [Xanthocytophaga flavus]MDJ1481513.1 4-hydroxy-3-methylbut-2-enyl diphosphate reductase [Xanthocytophaga flavus]MDJ1491491.1 4-hydroxy-3-methylbut-2-enyl diphosphate reductase [Xanthocytophaga flavus]
MLNLQVTIDTNSGFCFGVVYAIEMAEDILDEQGYLYCLGDIVHNDEEVNRLENKGLRIINHDQLADLQNEKVLIRAHGEPPSTYELALKNNIELIDASCPVVLKLQNRIKNSYDRDDSIFIYGKHGHAEVVGLLGQTNNEAVVFQDLSELNPKDMPRRITLYSQTTKSTDKFYDITKKLKEEGIEVESNDTICRQVSNRDKELRLFAKRFDKIIFVSGSKSSNGKVLFNVCKETNPNTFFVSKVTDITPDWFATNETVGICGATSTPMWLMEEVRNAICKL